MSDSLYNALPDSLKPAKPTNVSLEEIDNALFDLYPAFAYHYGKELEEIAGNLERRFVKLNNTNERIFTAHSIANYYRLVHNAKEAIKWYKQVVAMANPGNYRPDKLCYAYLNLGASYSLIGKVDSLIKIMVDARKILDAGYPDFKNPAQARLDIEYVLIKAYKDLLLYKNAVAQAKKVLTLTPKQDTMRYNSVQAVIGHLYAQMYQDEKKEKYADSAIINLGNVLVFTKDKSDYWRYYYYRTMGMLMYYMGKDSLSLLYNDSSHLPLYQKQGFNRTDKTDFYVLLSRIRMGDAAAVTELLQSRLPQEDFLLLENMNYGLFNYYKSKGNSAQALHHYVKYKSYTDSININRQRGVLFEIQQKYAVAQKEADIAVLQAKNEKARSLRNLIIITGIALLVIVTLLYYQRFKRLQGRRRAERRKLTEELHKMEQEMELKKLKLEAEREEIANAQKREISKDMHDEINSGLAGLRFMISDAKKNAPSNTMFKVLEDIEDEARTVYAQSRQFMHRLHNAGIVETYNVPELLESLRLKFDRPGNLQVFVDADFNQIDEAFTPRQHAELYRILKEAVANILKHSNATEVFINMYSKSDVFYFEVQDNGTGINGTASGGLGLATMKQRLASLKGNLGISSSENGTCLKGEFPISA